MSEPPIHNARWLHISLNMPLETPYIYIKSVLSHRFLLDTHWSATSGID